MRQLAPGSSSVRPRQEPPMIWNSLSPVTKAAVGKGVGFPFDRVKFTTVVVSWATAPRLASGGVRLALPRTVPVPLTGTKTLLPASSMAWCLTAAPGRKTTRTRQDVAGGTGWPVRQQVSPAWQVVPRLKPKPSPVKKKLGVKVELDPLKREPRTGDSTEVPTMVAGAFQPPKLKKTLVLGSRKSPRTPMWPARTRTMFTPSRVRPGNSSTSTGACETHVAGVVGARPLQKVLKASTKIRTLPGGRPLNLNRLSVPRLVPSGGGTSKLRAVSLPRAVVMVARTHRTSVGVTVSEKAKAPTSSGIGSGAAGGAGGAGSGSAGRA